MWSGGVALVLVLGAAHVAARAAGARAVADLSKAVPIALLAGLVAAEPAPVGQAYRWLVFAGLLCSLGGDVWLLFPRGFVAGLFNFLVAHLLYIAAFARGGGRGHDHRLRGADADRALGSRLKAERVTGPGRRCRRRRGRRPRRGARARKRRPSLRSSTRRRRARSGA